MASSNFQISGISSGFDTESILNKLLEVQKKPISVAQGRQAEATKQQAAWRTLNSKLLGLEGNLKKLSTADTYKGRQAVTSNGDVFGVSATEGADLGSFSVTVKQLAQQHQMISGGYALEDTKVGTGTVTLQVGAAQFPPITLTEENNTVAGLRNAINAANVGVRASVLDAGESAGANRYKLVLNSESSGLAGTVQLTSNLSGGAGVTMTDLQAAQDAQVVLGNGPGAVTVNSSSNKVTGILPGVTLELKKAQPDKAETMTLSRQSSSLRTEIEGFIENYNSVNSYFKSQFSYDKTTGAGGPLFGDSLALSLQDQLNRAATDTRQVDGKFSNLAAIGISLDKTGNLSISDEAAFSKALSNPEDVEKLFSDEQFGVATRLRKVVTSATDGVSGSVTRQDKALTERFDELDKTIALMNERVTRYEQMYRLRFLAMEEAMAEMKSQSSAVGASISSQVASSS